MRRIALATLFLALCVSAASAHYYTLYHTHLVTLAVSSEGEGKKVEKVTARVGVLATKPLGPGGGHWHYGSQPYWAGEQSFSLEQKGETFFGKVELRATELPGGDRMGPVMVQFTILFDDGTSMKLREKVVKVARSHNTESIDEFNRAKAKELKIYNDTEEAAETSCVSLCWATRRPPYF